MRFKTRGIIGSVNALANTEQTSACAFKKKVSMLCDYGL